MIIIFPLYEVYRNLRKKQDHPVAKLKDGILTLTFDLVTQEEKPEMKRIDIQTE
jgi:HSP20 family molecular chaperone IbpA